MLQNDRIDHGGKLDSEAETSNISCILSANVKPSHLRGSLAGKGSQHSHDRAISWQDLLEKIDLAVLAAD
jgi:hypothetical protein